MMKVFLKSKSRKRTSEKYCDSSNKIMSSSSIIEIDKNNCNGEKNVKLRKIPLIWNSRSPLGNFYLECKDAVGWLSYYSRLLLARPFFNDNPVNKLFLNLNLTIQVITICHNLLSPCSFFFKTCKVFISSYITKDDAQQNVN